MQADHVRVSVTEAGDVARWLPARVNGRDSNKGKFGHVMVFAGSGGFVGAPVMVAEAAARTGAGLVTLAVPEGIHQAADGPRLARRDDARPAPDAAGDVRRRRRWTPP